MIALNVDPRKQLLIQFFKRFPNQELLATSNSLLKLLDRLDLPMKGKPGGWAGGIVYAASSIGVGVPGVFNREVEEAFQVSMATIYTRAWQIRRLMVELP